MRKHKRVWVGFRAGGKWFQRLTLKEKLAYIKVPADEMFKAALAQGKHLEAMRILLGMSTSSRNRPRVNISVPISLAIGSRKEYEWLGEWTHHSNIHTPVMPASVL